MLFPSPCKGQLLLPPRHVLLPGGLQVPRPMCINAPPPSTGSLCSPYCQLLLARLCSLLILHCTLPPCPALCRRADTLPTTPPAAPSSPRDPASPMQVAATRPLGSAVCKGSRSAVSRAASSRRQPAPRTCRLGVMAQVRPLTAGAGALAGARSLPAARCKRWCRTQTRCDRR